MNSSGLKQTKIFLARIVGCAAWLRNAGTVNIFQLLIKNANTLIYLIPAVRLEFHFYYSNIKSISAGIIFKFQVLLHAILLNSLLQLKMDRFNLPLKLHKNDIIVLAWGEAHSRLLKPPGYRPQQSQIYYSHWLERQEGPSYWLL